MKNLVNGENETKNNVEVLLLEAILGRLADAIGVLGAER